MTLNDLKCWKRTCSHW